MNKKSLEDLLRKIFTAGNESISSKMIRISEVTFLDVNDNIGILGEKIRKSKRTFYPVSDGSRENIIGIIHIKDILINALSGTKINLNDGLHEPVYFNENITVHKVYDIFSQSNTGAGFIVDKENNITGFITLKELSKIFLGKILFDDDITEAYSGGR